MKLKLSSYHLISIILIQIVLIDIVLIVFLFGALNKENKNIPAAEISKSTQNKVTDKQEESQSKDTAPDKEEVKKASNQKNPPANKGESNQGHQAQLSFPMRVDTRTKLEKRDPLLAMVVDQQEKKLARNEGAAKESIVMASSPKEALTKKAENKLGKKQVQPAFSMRLGESSRAEKKDALFEIFHKVTVNSLPARDYKIMENASLEMLKEGEFTATAYDLSFESCGKYPGHPEYGITFSGKRAIKGRTVAVDPTVIPLGSKLHIEFQKPYTHLSGWYYAEDTGRLVKGRIIDIFFGESAFKEMEKFGRRKVKVKIVYPESSKYVGS
ncbi:MAG: 3D domain-containing protein [Clostridia bacterium]|nr:3D domain-containing protein [Clostridia bacterium]